MSDRINNQNIHANQKKLTLHYNLLTSAIFLCLAFVAFTMPAQAFRTDHGLLPPGTSTCDFHPPVTMAVPANAAAVPDPMQGQYSNGFFHVEEIRNKLFYMTDGVYQSIFLVDEEGIILVDAPPSIGINQQDPQASVNIIDVIFSIPETQGKRIKTLIYSHSHFDHIGAASIVKDAFPRVAIIAHRETKKQLRRGTGIEGPFLPGAGTTPPPLPNITFNNRTNIALGRQSLKLNYHGPAHEPGNIFIYAPKQQVLMLVDVIFPGWSPFSDLALAEDVPRFISAHDKVLKYNFTTFIGGHLNRLGIRADVEESKRYIADIRANAKIALSDPSLFAIFGIVPNNSLGAFSVYLDQVACKCANLTLNPNTTPSQTSWLNRFGVADSNTLGHCWTMAESLRIDPTF